MRRKRSPTHPAARQPRQGRRVADESRGKLAEIAGCPRCEASYRDGRWTWKPAPAGAYEQVCPACERIAQHYPAGVLRIEGRSTRAQRGDWIGLVENVEEREREEHPLKRVMSIEEEPRAVVVETTDARLAADLGRALHRAYGGRLELPPTTSDVENLARVRWIVDS